MDPKRCRLEFQDPLDPLGPQEPQDPKDSQDPAERAESREHLAHQVLVDCQDQSDNPDLTVTRDLWARWEPPARLDPLETVVAMAYQECRDPRDTWA